MGYARKSTVKRRLFAITGGVLGGIGLLVLIGFIFFRVSPWPTALLIRYQFDKGAQAAGAILENYVPENIAEQRNLQFTATDKDALLDVYYPAGTTTQLPTIVWVHGGGWISGSKDDMQQWAKILAGRGFTVVAPNYSIAPEKQYPTPVLQVNDALGYLQKHAQALHVDANSIILAGDSAGAHIAAQVALISTSPAYAQAVNIHPALPANAIKATLLACGPYDFGLINPDSTSTGARLVKTFLWSYTGKKDFYTDPAVQLASLPSHITSDFPPSFITAGNEDPLLKHSLTLAKTLQEKSVPTDTLFYPNNHTPALNHEYQFNLDLPDAKTALERMIAFAKQYTSQ